MTKAFDRLATALADHYPVEREYVGTTPHTNYSISPDGNTFAMVRRNPATRIMIVQNLPGLVRQLQGSSDAAR